MAESELFWTAVINNLIFDFLNIELSHEQLFFEDNNDPKNIGFFKDKGVSLDVGHNDSEYQKFGPHYDDATMRRAVDKVGAGNYCLIGNNCQSWADKVRKEYERLKREEEEDGKCYDF